MVLQSHVFKVSEESSFRHFLFLLPLNREAQRHAAHGKGHRYDELGYSDKLLHGIAEKKGAMIMSASSKTEMDKILKSKVPLFDGVRFIADRYLLPEEELICWSEASLRAPLNEYAFFHGLFCLFPICTLYLRFCAVFRGDLFVPSIIPHFFVSF